MKKLTILLVILAFLCLPSGAFAVPAYGNVGPTTEFGFDIYMADELVAEGSSANEHETTLTFTDPTGDRTITVPDSDQTIGTATAIENELIVEADLDGDEAPADNDILTYDTTGANFSWQTPAELDLVTTSGTPSDSQVAVWTADGIIEGAADFTYDGSNLQITGDIGATGAKITKGWFTDFEVANDIAGSITGNAETVTFAANEAEAEENEVLFAAGAAASGDCDVEADSGFTYNPSTGVLTAAGFAGPITGALTGNADTVTVDATTSDATCFILLGEDASGSLEPQTDATLTYAADTGLFFATIVTGEIRLVTSDADPDTTGEIKHDSTAAGFTGGVLRWFDNDTSRMIVDLETDAADDNYVVAYDADADGFYMKVDAFSGNYVEHFMDVHAPDDDYCHVQMAGTEANQDITTSLTSPDVPRNISVTYGTVGSSTGNVTITGTLADGTTAQTETFAIGAGDETVIGAKAFATVTKINIPDSFYAATVIDVGLDNLLGLSNSISAEADIYKVTLDGVDDDDAVSGNGDDTNNTLDCGTIAANSDYTIWYHN